jgi:succinyl-CoA synthetase alpha subunit
MAILVGADTRLLCQGLTGRAGTYHVGRMIAYGTQVAAGVTPGKGGRTHLDVPVFNRVVDAMASTGANTSMVFVPPESAVKAMIEAIEAEISLVVAVTERVPILDMVRVKHALRGSKTRLVGPNSQGILSPGTAQVGVMTTVNAKAGSIGIASRSATLTSEVMAQTTLVGLGQSTTVGVGGDPIHGLSLKDCVELFLDDPQTLGIVIIGEIGGTEEEEVADYVSLVRPFKPIVALVAGRHAPPERRMGHAGAFATHGSGAAGPKLQALEAAGIIVVRNAAHVGETMAKALGVHHRIGGDRDHS